MLLSFYLFNNLFKITNNLKNNINLKILEEPLRDYHILMEHLEHQEIMKEFQVL